MLEAADRIEDMERELAMLKADRDHLLACMERARAGRVECDGEGHAPRNMVHQAMLDAVKAERDEAKAKLALAEKRADEMEGKAGEWIALDVHRDRVAKEVAEWRESYNKCRMERDLARADAEAVKADRNAIHVRVLRALGCADAQVASVNTEGRCDACGVLPGSMHATDCRRRPGSLVVRKAGER
jgi:hypothetical protein